MSKVYGLVLNVKDMLDLHQKGLAAKTTAVGFSKSGKAYIWDDELKKHKEITIEEACDLLNVDKATIKKIIDTRCKFKVDDPVEETPQVEEINMDAIDNGIRQDEVKSLFGNPDDSEDEEEDDEDDDYEEDYTDYEQRDEIITLLQDILASQHEANAKLRNIEKVISEYVID